MKKVVKEIDVFNIRLKNIAKNNKVSLEEVMKKYEEKLKYLKEQNITVNLERIAVNAVMNEYRKTKVKKNLNGKLRQKKEVVIIHGFITGDRGVWDKAEQIRRTAKKYIEKNGLEAAREAQLIDGDNNILDTREKIYGRENSKYLEPLDPKIYVLDRILYGFFKREGETTYKYGSIQTSDNRLARGWSKVKFFTPCTVPAVIDDATEMILRSSSAEDTMSIFKGVKEDIDIKQVIDETLEGKWTEIGQVERQHELTKEAWNRVIFVKGIVAWIGIDRPTPIGTIKMGLMNPDNEDELVVVEIPEQLSIDFGELSEVYVFGKTRRNKYYNEEKELVDGDVTITATGIFPTIATPTERTNNKEQDDVEISGWVD